MKILETRGRTPRPAGGRRARAGRNLAALALLCLVLPAGAAPARPVAAQAPPRPPFGLPFGVEPGPSTWLLGQPYGNTTGAYFLGDLWYAAGQGLHFGLDFSAPCGTQVVSIGDGTVIQPDLMARGAGPHNLVVRYPAPERPDGAVAAIYGHLLRRPELKPGQAIVRGQPIAVTGDPDLTCSSRPHLHLEIRSLDSRTAYNPVKWIDADWNARMLLGSFSDVTFTRDLDDPLRWVNIEDQPDVHFGGAVLNRYRRAWPGQRGDVYCVVNGC